MKVTVKQVAEAMLLDDTPKTTGDLIRVESENGFNLWPGDKGYNEAAVYSCAVGGAALALGADAESLSEALQSVDRDGVPVVDYGVDDGDLYTTIYRWNDNSRASLSKAEVARKVLDNADEKTLNTVLTLRKQTKKRFLQFKKV